MPLVHANQLGREEARVIIARIKQILIGAYDDLLALYDGHAWLPLGYDSWGLMLDAEFNVNERSAYRLVERARQRRFLEADRVVRTQISEEVRTEAQEGPSSVEPSIDAMTSVEANLLGMISESLALFRVAMGDVRGLRARLEDIARSPAGFFLADHIQEVSIHLNNVASVIRFCAAHAICCYCGGRRENCTVCRNQGWLPFGLWSAAPDELKERMSHE